ncbi:LacI family DNA-binding transcriptional regulator [Clostridium formicaceticum]|uniref:HTH-type transcriptional repressor ExuR n=1 Tax=Clostridium formicaceticum TaxID=1497 RepID=A0AAC9RJ02_9CLOT|nr:LacI family DNA-binding transcriptional regulator [Clostridium formicaceticum]AOY76077.1 LacI family transcriptional regulator [Clostridium formicaceticum]ARE86439.1 putative HTH-type transcriptional repressor ExuR [Clostridium formicaceticum]
MGVTIKDIAKLANVSHTTVSRALNNSTLINSETKEKIKKLAMELNYIPNYSAKSLVLHKSYHIGLFFSTIDKDRGTSSSFFYEVVRGVNSIIKDQYNLVVKGISDYKSLSLIDTNNFDGIILMSQSAEDGAFIYHVLDKKIPLVVLNREIEHRGLINILSDDKKGAYNATKYLVKCGHEKIAIIEGKAGFKSAQERKEGFLDALIDHNVPVNKNYMIKGNYDFESGYEGMKQLLENENKPTAVFCSNDDMAIGAMKAIFENKMKIPEDISIVGFDNNTFTPFLTPALTTVKRPIMEISQDGAKKLISLIEKEEVEKERVYVNTELIIRDSVKNLK